MSEMVENLQFNIRQAGSDFSIVVLGAIIGFTPHYEEIEEIIEDFCEEHNINTASIIVNEY